MREDLTLEQIADALNHTEADVRRAVNYWQKAGVLETVQESTVTKENTANWHIDLGKWRPQHQRNGCSPDTGSCLFSCSGKPLKWKWGIFTALYIAQKYLKTKLLLPGTVRYLLIFMIPLVWILVCCEYLAEYCAQNGHTSVRYLETVALNWHEKEYAQPKKLRNTALPIQRMYLQWWDIWLKQP